VGLEDNLWFDQQRTRPADNTALIKRVVAQAALLERPLISARALRQTMGIAC
jgi:uncharacterized protein (DUF849 family)